MKFIITIIVLFFGFSNFLYASDKTTSINFADEYAQEVKAKNENKNNNWNIVTKAKAGLATYEEEEQTIKSDYDAVYLETSCAAINRTENDIEKEISCSFGQSTTDTETWYVSNIKYQTNDLNFYRVNLRGSIGKILYSDKYKNLQATPFLGYGFRYINFERTNFNILNIITSRDIVTEKYSIHHIDCGIKFNYELNEKWDIYGLGLFGYVFYNQADNSSLGKVKGGGGTLAEANINLRYSLSDSLQIVFGGFIEAQDLRGGDKNNVIWPDNKLNIYAGDIGVRIRF